MSRAFWGSSSARNASIVAALAIALPLSGCVSAAIPEGAETPQVNNEDWPAPQTEEPSQTPSEKPSASPSAKPSPKPSASSSTKPSPSPTTSPSTEPKADGDETFTFSDGTTLSSTSNIQWSDGLLMNTEWTMESPDDGNGNWSYRSPNGDCVADFWQGLLDGTDTSSGDDKIVTDIVIAQLFNSTPEEVDAAATSERFAYQVGGNLTLENRVVSGVNDEGTWLLSVRAFASANVGVYHYVTCATGGPDGVIAAVDEVNEANSVIVVP